ncbi:hypothetical protein HK096_010692, partial [Nowakowskiella sp. JEL0078]
MKKELRKLKKEIKQKEIIITDLTSHLKKMGTSRSTSLINNPNRTPTISVTENRTFSIVQHEINAEIAQLHENLESETTNLLAQVKCFNGNPTKLSLEEKVTYLADQFTNLCEDRDSLLEVIYKTVDLKKFNSCTTSDLHTHREFITNNQNLTQLQVNSILIETLIEELTNNRTKIVVLESKLADYEERENSQLTPYEGQLETESCRIAWFQKEHEKIIAERNKLVLELKSLRLELNKRDQCMFSMSTNDEFMLLKVKLHEESSTKIKLNSQLTSLEEDLLSAAERIAILTIMTNSAQKMLEDINLELADAVHKAEKAEKNVLNMENWVETLVVELDMANSKMKTNLMEKRVENDKWKVKCSSNEKKVLASHVISHGVEDIVPSINCSKAPLTSNPNPEEIVTENMTASKTIVEKFPDLCKKVGNKNVHFNDQDEIMDMG